MTGPVSWEVRPDWQQKMLPGVVAMLQGIGDEMVTEMQNLVPKGTRDYQGPRLEDTLFARVIQRRNARGQFGNIELEVGADADYALDVEFGHLTVGGSSFVEAQPFIRPVVYKFRGGSTNINPGSHNFIGNPPVADPQGGLVE